MRLPDYLVVTDMACALASVSLSTMASGSKFFGT